MTSKTLSIYHFCTVEQRLFYICIYQSWKSKVSFGRTIHSTDVISVYAGFLCFG